MIPEEYALEQNYPNPFNPQTTIPFSLKQKTHVKINIYNMSGQIVESLINRDLEAGQHRIDFDATNLPSGMYIYRIFTDDFTQSKKMLLLK